MDTSEFNQRLSQITTRWSMIFQAHQDQPGAATAAQRALMQRYGGAVHRYLLAALRDPDLADELAQEFAYRFLRGDFRRAHPDRGRFRDFVKRAILNLIIDFHRRKKTRPRPLPAEELESAALAEEPDFDRQFVESWRTELLDRTWKALAGLEAETGRPFHTVLRFRVNHPDLNSSASAEELGKLLAKRVTAGWVRQTLYRARQKFARLLYDEVAQSLDEGTREQVEQELSDLGLLEYCQPALERRGDSG